MNITNAIHNHLDKKLPFVVFRKPNTQNISGLFQETDTLFHSNNYQESGFVFAPFDSSVASVLIPESASKRISENWEPHEDKRSKLSDGFIENAKEEHIALVAKTVQEIKETGIQKIVISRKEKVVLEDADVITIFFRLLSEYKKAMVYIWFHPKVGLWIGATPETLLKLNQCSFSTMSLAATRPFENTLEVSWNSKELEEQSLVTDFITHQLKGVSDDYTVHALETVRAGNVVHLRTLITGELMEKERGLLKLIQALHPTPAVCGLPREAAKKFILAEEGYERKYYTGFLGEIHVQNASELFVNLRCMEVERDTAFLYVGGGITAESIPEEEWEETRLKTRTLKKVL